MLVDDADVVGGTCLSNSGRARWSFCRIGGRLDVSMPKDDGLSLHV